MTKKSNLNKYRTLVRYHHDSGDKAASAHRHLVRIYGDDAPCYQTVNRWMARIRAGELSLEDRPRSGRPKELSDAALTKYVRSHSRASARQIAAALGVSHSLVSRRMKQLGFSKTKQKKTTKRQARGSQGRAASASANDSNHLTEAHMAQRVEACTELLQRHNEEPFLDRLITGGVKHVQFRPPVNTKYSWCAPGQKPLPMLPPQKEGSLPTHILFSIFWGRMGVAHVEALKPFQRVTGPLYAQQLGRLATSVHQKRPSFRTRKVVALLRDNATAHTSAPPTKKLAELGWEVLPHPPNSPDLMPSAYHLFPAMEADLKGRHFDTPEELKAHVLRFLESCDAEFWQEGINQLPSRWQRVIEAEGAYLTG